MASRDIRDQQQEVGTPPSSSPAPASATPSPFLIVPPLDLQRTAVAIVLSDFDSAESARRERNYGTDSKGVTMDFERWLKDLTDLYFGRRLPKTIPWRFSSNRSLMIAMAILEVLHSRIFPAVYNEELTHFRPLKVVDQETAARVEKLMAWWIRIHASMREFFDRWTRYCIGFGSVTSVPRWDLQELTTGKETPAQSTVNPDGTVAVQMPQPLSDRIERTRVDLIPIEDVFLPKGSSDFQRDTVLLRRTYLYRQLEDMEREGVIVNITTPSKIDGQVLRDVLIVPAAAAQGSTPEMQKELEDIKRRNLPVEVLEEYTGIDLDADGKPEQVRVMVSKTFKIFLGAVKISDLSARGLRHLEHTLFMPRLDEPNGWMGLGVLEQVKELALEIDAIFNQLTDSNSLSILRPGFYDPSGDVDAGAINLAPNRMIPVTRPKDNIFFPEIDIPTERLILAIRLVMEFIERLTSASSVIFGKPDELVGGSGTATRTEAIIGAAQQHLSIPMQRLREGAARILTQVLDLVQVNLPPGMEERIVGEKGEPVFDNPLTREAIAGDFVAYLLPDEALGSKELDRQLSQLLYTLMTQNVLVATDPAKLYKVTADVYKSFGKDPEVYLGPEPPMNMLQDPDQENTSVLQGQFAQVQPTLQQNHLEHIMRHQALLQDAAFQTLPPALQQQVAQFLQQHIQQHMQLMMMVLQLVAKLKPGGGFNAAQSNGAQPGAPGPTAPIGPEPGLGAAQSPLAQSRSVQRRGESQTAA